MNNLLEVENLRKYFPVGRSLFHKPKDFVHAVDDVSFDVKKGEDFGLAGESGCGKTTLGRLILRLIEPTSGKIRFDGKEMLKLSKNEMKSLRREIQVVFQDPLASLNPRHTVRQILAKPFNIQHNIKRNKIQHEVSDLLEKVGLTPVKRFVDRHVDELSGGQQQRVCIARAIALRPRLIVADEPVSQLDMSIKVHILRLLGRLKSESELTFIFITHDLSVLRSVSQTVAIMYLGKIVEISTTDRIFEDPMHPYTQSLLASTPIPDPKKARRRTRVPLRGEVPSAIDLPTGCRFHSRCPIARISCAEEEPELVDTGEGHLVACHKMI